MYDVTKTPNYEKALAWVNGINSNRWKLLTMKIRSRNPATKEGVVEKPRPVIIQRFVSGCPKECLREAIEILNTTSPYAKITVDCHEYEGPYRSTILLWSRDVDAVTDRGDATLTLKQTLVLSLSPDDFDAIVKINCSGTTEARYVWDASEVEALPTTAEPGITWQIGGINRDDNTGLFSYYILKTTANAYFFSYEAQENNYELVTKDKWKNLMPDDFDPSLAGVPVPGTLVEVEADKNEDCTLDVIATTTKAAPKSDIQRTTADDVYKAQESMASVAQAGALPEAPEAVDGLMLKHSSQQRKDLLWDVSVDKTQEHLVDNAQTSVSVTLEATITETTDIKATPLPAPTEVGDKVDNERTPGNLFKRTYRRMVRALRDKIKEVFSEDLFKDEYSKTSIETTPAIDPGFSGGGLVKTASSEQTELGSWRVNRSQTQEKTVLEAGVSVEATINGVVREETSIDSTPLAYPAADAIGERVSNKKTPGSWFERTRRYLVRVLLPRVAQQYSEDQFVASVGETNIEPDRPANDTTFSAGEIKKTSSIITETGAFRVSRETETSKAVLDENVLVSEDFLERVVADAGVHQVTLPPVAFSNNFVRALGQWARNTFGRYEYRRTITQPKNAVQEEVTVEDTALSSAKTSSEWNHAGAPVGVAIAGEGTYAAVITEQRPQKNRFGLFDVLQNKSFPKKKTDIHEFSVGNYYFWYAFFRNLTRDDLVLLLAQANAKANQFATASVSPSLSHNAFGLIDGVVSVTYRDDNSSSSPDYTIFDYGPTKVAGPYIYNWNKDSEGKKVYQRIRYQYDCYYQQGHDYAHGLQDFHAYGGEPPNEEMGSGIQRLGGNWYFYKKVYGTPTVLEDWTTVGE